MALREKWYADSGSEQVEELNFEGERQQLSTGRFHADRMLVYCWSLCVTVLDTFKVGESNRTSWGAPST
jgi:hypothetical protein